MTRYTILEDHEDYTPRSIQCTKISEYSYALRWCWNNLRGDQYSVDDRSCTVTFYTASAYMRYICEKF